MRRLAIMLTLVLCTVALEGCQMSLRTHANASLVSGDLIDAAGEEIAREAHEDVADVEQSGIDVEARKHALHVAYSPIWIAYDNARAAHIHYFRAITQAVEQGHNSLEAGAAKRLLDAWNQVLIAGEGIGVQVPDPPPALVRIAGGG